MTEYLSRLIIVVDVGQANAANGHAETIDTSGGNRTFTVGLSPTGNLPATHCWCSWAMKKTEESSLRTLLASMASAGQTRIFDGNTQTPEDVLRQMSLQRIVQLR